MKIITSTNILLDQNIISIYTNVELFLDHIDKYMDDELYFLHISEKERVQIQSLLHLDSASNTKEKFIGIFYCLDPHMDEIHLWWTTLTGSKNYNIFLKALSDDDLFVATDKLDDVIYTEDNEISTITEPEEYVYAEYEADEYDSDDEELELDVLDAYLETWDDDDGQQDTADC